MEGSEKFSRSYSSPSVPDTAIPCDALLQKNTLKKGSIGVSFLNDVIKIISSSSIKDTKKIQNKYR